MTAEKRPIVAEHGGTDFRVGIAAVISFCTVIAIAAPVQLAYDLGTGRRLQPFDIFRSVPTLERIERYEDELTEASIVANSTRPYVQWLTRLTLHQGNEKVVLGRDGWLFYRPSLLYPTGPDFRSRYIEADAAVKDWDPLPAIIDFASQVASRDIQLVLVPVPSKSQIYPEKLTRACEGAPGPPVNSHTSEFYRRLYDSGVVVIDLAQDMWNAKNRGQLYHALDTHWTPLGMEVFADALAAKLRVRYPWLAEQKRRYRSEPAEVTHRGDIYDMLDLPEWSELYPARSVTVQRVLNATTGAVAQSDSSAEVVLLGDSFTNVMSMKELGWGDGAGLGEHMMLRLARPIDVIARNGGAATATRVDLARRGSLENKRLIIWTIVTREFIAPASEWARVPLLRKGADSQKAVAGGEIVVTAEITATSKPPVPGAVPYASAVTMTRYRVSDADREKTVARELVAAQWVMKKHKLTKAAAYRTGAVQRLRLIPLIDQENRDPSVRQARTLDDTNGVRDMLDAYWVVEIMESERS